MRFQFYHPHSFTLPFLSFIPVLLPDIHGYLFFHLLYDFLYFIYSHLPDLHWITFILMIHYALLLYLHFHFFFLLSLNLASFLILFIHLLDLSFLCHPFIYLNLLYNFKSLNYTRFVIFLNDILFFYKLFHSFHLLISFHHQTTSYFRLFFLPFDDQLYHSIYDGMYHRVSQLFWVAFQSNLTYFYCILIKWFY